MKVLIKRKAKKILKIGKKNRLVQYFKDNATAFNNKKKFLKCALPIPENNAFKGWKKLLFSKMKYNNQANTAIYNHDKANNYGTLSSSIIALPNKKIANTMNTPKSINNSII